MNTKLLLLLSAFTMGLTGVLLVFLPEEITAFLGLASTGLSVLILQLLGTLYFAFAILNWMVKNNLIGGIYGRPVALANVAHFMSGAITCIKAAPDQGSLLLWILTAVYALFAIGFIRALYTHPIKSREVAP